MTTAADAVYDAVPRAVRDAGGMDDVIVTRAIALTRHTPRSTSQVVREAIFWPRHRGGLWP